MITFQEWQHEKKRRSEKLVPKNPGVDKFLQAVDNLKRDIDTLDAVEKNAKKSRKSKLRHDVDSDSSSKSPGLSSDDKIQRLSGKHGRKPNCKTDLGGRQLEDK